VVCDKGKGIAVKAGIIVNASAGKFGYIKKVISRLKEVFEEIVTGSGRFGGDFLEDVETIDVAFNDFKNAIGSLTVELSKRSDVIVSVGGDGTANLVAATIIDEGLDIPLMGIAGGTANVGPLIRFSFETVEKPSHVEFIDCLKVWKDEEHVGYAFVDAVFGDTFLGTLNGGMVNLSVEDFLKSGKKVPKKPRDDVVKKLEVLKNGKEVPLRSRRVAQVVASPLNSSTFYIGKAATGILSWASFLESRGILVLSSRVIVDSHVSESDLNEPVLVEQILFGEETIEIKGFDRSVYLVLDGNPVCECNRPIKLEGLRNCVKVVTKGQSCDWPVGWKT